MKFSCTVITLCLSFSNYAYAFKCNTVMGGCPSDNAQATSAHMHSELKPKVSTTLKENQQEKERSLDKKSTLQSNSKK